jgi:hypothetical protein
MYEKNADTIDFSSVTDICIAKTITFDKRKDLTIQQEQTDETATDNSSAMISNPVT